MISTLTQNTTEVVLYPSHGITSEGTGLIGNINFDYVVKVWSDHSII